MRPRTRTALAAFGVGTVVAATVAVFEEKQHALVSFAVAVIPVAWGALAGILAWWLRGRRVPEGTTAAQLSAAADWLAGATAANWRREAEARRIITPAPASVRWRWAAGELTAPRPDLAAPPATGTGPPPLPGLVEPGEILGSGVVTRMHDEVYARLPHGRLVMVGGPGSGKTGAMILLLLAALERRAGLAGDARQQVPVPAWLSLSGWDPETEPLHDWAANVLNRDYPSLRAPGYGAGAAPNLIRRGRMALFLDGLDEMPPDVRPVALRRLNTETADLRVVLTSRLSEYRLAVEDATVDNVAVVELRPVRPDAAAAYLLYGQSGPGRARWEKFCVHLRDNPASIVTQALDNPLTLSLARDAYVARDPGVLADPARFPDTDSITGHLLDQFLVTAYPDQRQRAGAVRWLSWIAWNMGTGQNLQWWDIPNWVPRWRLRLARGLLTGVAVGIMVSVMAWLNYQALEPAYAPGFIARIAPGIGTGVGLALLSGLVGRLTPGPPAARSPRPPRRARIRPTIAPAPVPVPLSFRNVAPVLSCGVLIGLALAVDTQTPPGTDTGFLPAIVLRLLLGVFAGGIAIFVMALFQRMPTREGLPELTARPYLERFDVGAAIAGLAVVIGVMAWAWAWVYGVSVVLRAALAAGAVTVGVCAFVFIVRDQAGIHGFGLTGSPRALATPRWPRLPRNPLFYLLGLPVLLPFIVPTLLNAWATPADLASATPASTYRADRRACVIYACAYALLPGIPVGLVIAGTVYGYPGLIVPPATKALIVLGWVITAAAVTWLLAWQHAGRAPLVTLAQIVLRSRPGSGVSFTRLLEDALARQVLRQAGAVYQFRHTTLQTRLAIRYRPPKHGSRGMRLG